MKQIAEKEKQGREGEIVRAKIIIFFYSFLQHDVINNDMYTYSEANNMINTIAQNLYQRYGFRPGDQFAFFCFNQIECAFMILAVWKLRGVYIGIEPNLIPGKKQLFKVIHRLLYLLNHNSW